MSSQYISWPPKNVPAFPSFSQLPVPYINGALATTLDTYGLFIFDGDTQTWLAVGGSSVPLSVGTLDGQPASADGASFAMNMLFMQSATAADPGLVNNTTQSFSGDKTFTGAISASNLSGTNTGDVTLGIPNGLSISAQVLSLDLSSTSTTGALSSTDWNTFNNKQPAITEGDLTEATSAILNITGGSGAVIGSGTSIQVKQSTTAQDGYLSSTDWNTFNGKQGAGNYITALTGDGTAAGPGSSLLTLATVNSNVGSFGSSTAIPSFTVNAKGLVTAASTNVVIAPAGTLTGTTLASGVVSSSLTSVGTVATGVWQGTPVDITYGGSGQATANDALNAFLPSQTGNSDKVLTTDGTNTSWTSVSGSSTAPTVQQFTSSSGTYTTPTSPSPLYIVVEMVGGGGGGGGSGGTSSSPSTAAMDGGDSTFGTSLLVAGGGVGASNYTVSTSAGDGGAGGTASLGSGPVGIAVGGGSGSAGIQSSAVNGINGGAGASSAFGGSGGGGSQIAAGTSATPNTGGGGGGGGGPGNAFSGSGGGSGAYIKATIVSPSSTYDYVVGDGGTHGSAGPSGAAGGDGGSGLITVWEYYQ